VPPRSIILLEDIDSFFKHRDKADASVKLSYSGFINALDGVAAHEGSVIFLTTNHPELIDEAAIRSGRVDFRMELTHCDKHQLYAMAHKFFEDKAMANAISETIPAGKLSPALVQECLLKSKNLEDALRHLRAA
jgi:chaperone BCS1